MYRGPPLPFCIGSTGPPLGRQKPHTGIADCEKSLL